MCTVTAFAPAKINLTLHVGAPRADGRHPLASLVAFADVGDEVILSEGAGAFAVSGPFAGDLAREQNNLVTRALALIAPEKSVRAALVKNLPVASGIGGGSSDAAAALRAARLLFDLDIDDAELARRAALLGADLPVCVYARPALMTGTGEEVAPADFALRHAVLVNPGIALPTASVYRRYDEIGRFGDLAGAYDVEGGRNDLEQAARDLAPAVGEALDMLRAEPGARLARMSGSGATCFALTQDAAGAQAMVASLRQRRPNWWVQPAQLGGVDVTPRRG